MMTMMRTGPGLAAVATALLLAPLGAQQRPPSFRAGVQTVPVYATVIDAAGRLVPDLEEKDFEIYDDAKKQELTIFKSEVQPVSVVVMVDTSGSMTANIDLLKNGAEKFVIRLLPGDRARIGSFSDKIVLSPEFTGDRDALVRYLHEEIDYGNPTRLWDAAYRSMDALAREENRRVVLLFTDGDDSDSRLHSFGDVLRRAQAEDFMVYGIGFRSHVLGTITKPDPGLKKLATETGGGYFELKTGDELNSTFSRVADELHRQYVLGFSPAVLDGKVHKLNVVVKRTGMTARARQSYVAAPSK
jgi:Ca-activated chloride channel family protein